MPLDRRLAGRIPDTRTHERLSDLAAALGADLQSLSIAHSFDAPGAFWGKRPSLAGGLPSGSVDADLRLQFARQSLSEFEQRVHGYEARRERSLRLRPKVHDQTPQSIAATMSDELANGRRHNNLADQIISFARSIAVLDTSSAWKLRRRRNAVLDRQLAAVTTGLEHLSAEDLPPTAPFRLAWPLVVKALDIGGGNDDRQRRKALRSALDKPVDPENTLADVMATEALHSVVRHLRGCAARREATAVLLNDYIDLPAEQAFLAALTTMTRSVIAESAFFTEVSRLLGDDLPEVGTERYEELVSSCDPRTPGWRLPAPGGISRDSQPSVADR
jgi:ParB-like chromosome segregation protein Spo0J